MSGGTGDADMYVRYGDKPTTSTYDCRPYVIGNEEVCTFTPPKEGTYQIMIKAYSAYTGLSMVAKYQ
jgi:hypothetical protein